MRLLTTAAIAFTTTALLIPNAQAMPAPTTVGHTAAPAAVKVIKYTSCKKLNVRFPHGVGRPGAHDKVRTGKPVTNFTRNLAWYKANAARLDRDHDGIACEKH